jgi:outer membrane lipoprotein-sorting protein
VLEYVPREDTAVVWGKIVAWIDAESYAPLQQEFYDEDGTKLRVMRFSDLRQLGERTMAHRWLLIPLEKPGHRTEILIESVEFDAQIEESVFTTRNLKRAR